MIDRQTDRQKFKLLYNFFLSNVHKIGDAHLQCVIDHYAKFQYIEMKSVGFTDYTTQTPSQHF